MNKIMIIFGTRPEAIKLCPIVLELLKHSDMFKVVVCVTAQHREMLDQVLNIFDVKPDYDLNLMQENQTLSDITANVLIETGKVIKKEKPDIVIVQGDTTTAFAASLAAFYNQIKIGHIEAGLRTGSKYSPFPEEINRLLTSHIADIHFAPTQRNKKNLLSEGIAEEKIIITGNTVIDALLWVTNKIRSENKKYKKLANIDFSKRIILVTGHRRENFGKGFINLCDALRAIAEKNKDVEIVYPVHLNPNVKEPVYELLSGIKNIKLIEPIDYEPFIYLMDRCYFIISDSGGIQEEAPSLGKPVLVTRDTTERPEALEVGAVKLVGTNKDKIILESERLFSDSASYQRMSKIQNPFGDGHASEKIISNLDQFLNTKNYI
jgi:UDP-N-acetylglucosamine 2-epimerase (non-hydrolysing)